MSDRRLKILSVSTADGAGGAESVAWNLFQAYRALGHDSWLAVGRKQREHGQVFTVPNDDCRNWWARGWIYLGNELTRALGGAPGYGRSHRLSNWIGQPKRSINIRRGHEDFEFPGTRRILQLPVAPPDILHCHNLHGYYFDLRSLPWMSKQVPVVLTLHDAWLLSGHCAHSLGCERWKSGCGSCPDLRIYPAIRRDATASNWRRKRDIYTGSRLHIATPCQWLMDMIQKSILNSAAVETRVIPHGIDLSIFRPGEQSIARETLGLPRNCRILLFAATGIRKNRWKDFETMRAAVAKLVEHLKDTSLLFVALGEEAHEERVGNAEIRFVPFEVDQCAVAEYYRAADVYIHAAKVDTFPMTVLEALACGTPVVATAVGGVPEQVRDGITGFLVPQEDVIAMSTCIARLLDDRSLLHEFGNNAVKDAHLRFDLEQQAREYAKWCQTIVERRGMQLSKA